MNDSDFYNIWQGMIGELTELFQRERIIMQGHRIIQNNMVSPCFPSNQTYRQDSIVKQVTASRLPIPNRFYSQN